MHTLTFEQITDLISQRLSEKTRTIQITETPAMCVLDDLKTQEQFAVLRPDIQRLCDDHFIRESIGGTVQRRKFVAPVELTHKEV